MGLQLESLPYYFRYIIYYSKSYFNKLAPQYDNRDRIIGYDDFYIPSMWSINGIAMGTRLIKSRSHPNITYSFFFIMRVPLFPLRCYCYDLDYSNQNEDPICYWGLAKWNILDIFIK